MTLNLEPYQAPIPYPEVRGVKPDSGTVAVLMGGYCGGTSELTTVLQYAYHSLRCSRKYGEVSRMMRGIFYVETLHMELLGDCISRLGADPRYNLAVGEKEICWQGTLVEYETSPAKMLLADIEGEKEAVAYYEQMAAEIRQPEISRLMARLAEDERLHVQMLTDLYRRTFRR